jgi:nucleotide-binding universal stress UspA family protein
VNTYRIVVGVDGSEGGDRALRWAVREAERRGGTVQAITAWTWDGIEGAVIAKTHPAEERARTEQALARSVSAVTTTYPSVPVAAEAIEGAPAKVLATAAKDAELLVLGSHGHSRFFHAVLGSVTEECIRAATCPVVVVPTTVTQPVGA